MSLSIPQVRFFVLERVRDELLARELTPEEIADDFDLLAEGVIDSLGILELISALEEELGISIDFEEMDPDQLTIIGPLCHFVVENAASDGSTAP